MSLDRALADARRGHRLGAGGRSTAWERGQAALGRTPRSPRLCDMCLEPYPGRCAASCPGRACWRRRDVAQSLAMGVFPPGLAARSPLVGEARQTLERQLQEAIAQQNMLVERIIELESLDMVLQIFQEDSEQGAAGSVSEQGAAGSVLLEPPCEPAPEPPGRHSGVFPATLQPR